MHATDWLRVGTLYGFVVCTKIWHTSFLGNGSFAEAKRVWCQKFCQLFTTTSTRTCFLKNHWTCMTKVRTLALLSVIALRGMWLYGTRSCNFCRLRLAGAACWERFALGMYVTDSTPSSILKRALNIARSESVLAFTGACSRETKHRISVSKRSTYCLRYAFLNKTYCSTVSAWQGLELNCWLKRTRTYCGRINQLSTKVAM